MNTARNLAAGIVVAVASVVGTLTYTGDLRFGTPVAPMPPATPTPMVTPSGKPQPAPTVAQVKRLEIVGDDGKPAAVITTDKSGKAIAIIADGDRGLVMDLVWLARRAN